MSIKGNNNLNKAKNKKDDEFYTYEADITNELKHYKKYFGNKTIFCNCDDPQFSEFWKYFKDNFDHLGIKKVIATHFSKKGSSYYLKLDKDGINEFAMTGNGDFRSDEALKLLKESDVVVTNPPFSLFRDFIKQMYEHNKKFIIIGSDNARSYKEIFPLIIENKMWTGMTRCKKFKRPDGTIKKFGNVGWYTNIENRKRIEELDQFGVNYSERNYTKYDNVNAIEVPKISLIPNNYNGLMGVPLSFVDKYNPKQFEIIGVMSSTKIDHRKYQYGYPYIKGIKKYARFLVRWKNENK